MKKNLSLLLTLVAYTHLHPPAAENLVTKPNIVVILIDDIVIPKLIR